MKMPVILATAALLALTACSKGNSSKPSQTPAAPPPTETAGQPPALPTDPNAPAVGPDGKPVTPAAGAPASGQPAPTSGQAAPAPAPTPEQQEQPAPAQPDGSTPAQPEKPTRSEPQNPQPDPQLVIQPAPQPGPVLPDPEDLDWDNGTPAPTPVPVRPRPSQPAPRERSEHPRPASHGDDRSLESIDASRLSLRLLNLDVLRTLVGDTGSGLRSLVLVDGRLVHRSEIEAASASGHAVPVYCSAGERERGLRSRRPGDLLQAAYLNAGGQSWLGEKKTRALIVEFVPGTLVLTCDRVGTRSLKVSDLKRALHGIAEVHVR